MDFDKNEKLCYTVNTLMTANKNFIFGGTNYGRKESSKGYRNG